MDHQAYRPVLMQLLQWEALAETEVDLRMAGHDRVALVEQETLRRRVDMEEEAVDRVVEAAGFKPMAPQGFQDTMGWQE